MDEECCDAHDRRITVLELRAQAQATAVKWSFASATLIIGISGTVLALLK